MPISTTVERSSYKRYFSEKIGIADQDFRLVKLFFLYRLFQSASIAFFMLAAYGLFLGEAQISSLPWVYLYAGIGTVLLGGIYSYFERFRKLNEQLFAAGFLLLAGFLLMRLQTGLLAMGWVAAVSFVWLMVCRWVSQMMYYILSDRLFDLRQNRLLNNLVYWLRLAAYLLGFIIGAVLSIWITEVSFSSLALIGSFMALLALNKILQHEGVKKESAVYHQQNPQNDWWLQGEFLHTLKRNSYLQQLLLLGGFTAFSIPLVAYLFFFFAGGSYGTYTHGFALLCIFLLLTYILASLASFFLNFYRIGQYGIKIILLSLPVFMMVGTLLLGLFAGFYSSALLHGLLAALLLGGVVIAYEALYQPVFLTLFQPLSPRLRNSSFLFMQLVAVPLATVLAGLVLLAMPYNWGGYGVGVLLLLVGGAWCLLVSYLKQAYVQNLHYALNLRFIEGAKVTSQDKYLIALLEKKLLSGNPEEVVYALETLQKLAYVQLSDKISQLLEHPSDKVKVTAIEKVQELALVNLAPQIREIIESGKDEPMVAKAIQTYLALKPTDLSVLDQLVDTRKLHVKKGVISGLLSTGQAEERQKAVAMLQKLLNDPDYQRQIEALEMIAELGVEEFKEDITYLLKNGSGQKKRLAILCARQLKSDELLPHLIELLYEGEFAADASFALLAFGERSLPLIERTLAFATNVANESLHRFCKLLGRISGPEACRMLWQLTNFPMRTVQQSALYALQSAGYKVKTSEDHYFVYDQINKQVERLDWFYRALVLLEEQSSNTTLYNALVAETRILVGNIKLLTAFLHNKGQQNVKLIHAEQANDFFDAEVEEFGSTEKAFWESLPPDIHEKLMVTTGFYSYETKVERLSKYYSHYLADYINVANTVLRDRKETTFSRWTQATALFALNDIPSPKLMEQVFYFLASDDFLLLEPALLLLEKFLNRRNFEAADYLQNQFNPTRTELLMGLLHSRDKPLMEIEKVIILKTTKMFSETPEQVITEIAGLLKEVRVKKGQAIFHKGDPGDCMYIIYEGEVCIQDGDFVLTTMINKDFFGDLGLLDANPRSASAIATRDSLLLRLDQDDFYDIIADRKEVVKGIMHVLCNRIRAQSAITKNLRNNQANGYSEATLN